MLANPHVPDEIAGCILYVYINNNVLYSKQIWSRTKHVIKKKL